MKSLTHTMLSTLAAAVLLGISGSASAGSTGSTGHDSDRFSGDLRYSVYHIAAENDAMKSGSGMEAGQAGRAGPESVPMGKTGGDLLAWPDDTRHSVYHIAAEYEAAKKAGMLSGQAGPAGPETLTKGRIDAGNASDIRFSIYDDSGRTSW